MCHRWSTGLQPVTRLVNACSNLPFSSRRSLVACTLEEGGGPEGLLAVLVQRLRLGFGGRAPWPDSEAPHGGAGGVAARRGAARSHATGQGATIIAVCSRFNATYV